MRRPAGRVHAGGVGAMEAAHPPRDGDHRHGWATGAQHSAQGLLVVSFVGAAARQAVSIICLNHQALAGAPDEDLSAGQQVSLIQ